MRPVKVVFDLVGVVIVSAALAAVLVGCGSEAGNSTPVRAASDTSIVADGLAMVRYELSGTAISVDGTYSEPVEGIEKLVELRQEALPWSRNFTIAPNQLFVAGLSAHAPNLESSITCKIIRNGAVIAHETGPFVDCRAEVATTPS